MSFFASLALMIGLFAVLVGPTMFLLNRYAPFLREDDEAVTMTDTGEAAIVPGTNRRV